MKNINTRLQEMTNKLSSKELCERRTEEEKTNNLAGANAGGCQKNSDL